MKKMPNPSHKEVYRMFWNIKGHLEVTEKTARDCYEGYFRRAWGNHEMVYHEDGFEEAYTKKFLTKAKN